VTRWPPRYFQNNSLVTERQARTDHVSQPDEPSHDSKAIDSANAHATIQRLAPASKTFAAIDQIIWPK
jgi:hypothetical protein